jgi:hypothetical protein
MAHREAKLLKQILLDVDVTPYERAVLLDMATAVVEGSTRYTWGHDRLAGALGKRPRTTAAKRALSGRIIPSLVRKGLIAVAEKAHPGRNAEYELLVLHEGWEPVATESAGKAPMTHPGMGTGLEQEWVPVSTNNGYRFGAGMGTGLSGTPAPSSAPSSAPIKQRRCNSDLRRRSGDVPWTGVVSRLECHVEDVVSHRAMVSENCLGISRKDTNARWLLTSLPSSTCSGN